jgi:hypothetical protein
MVENSNKLVVRLVGGLGNQLFIYAAAKYLASVLNRELVLDVQSGFIFDYKYKRKYVLGFFNVYEKLISHTIFIFFVKYILMRIEKKLDYYRCANRKYFEFNMSEHSFEKLLMESTRKVIYIEGYFQTNFYWLQLKSVNTVLSPAKFKLLDHTDSSSSMSGSCVVGVHVRFFDTLDENPEYLKKITKYYRDAILVCDSLFKRVDYHVVTNDISKLNRIWPSNVNYSIINLNYNEFNDEKVFWYLSQFRNIIISNSTFSWWAAVLGKKKELVIAPKNDFSTGSNLWDEGILLDDWIRI